MKPWLQGNVELADHRRIPEPGQRLFFNFDKMTDRVYVTDGISKIWNYPGDSVNNFSLADSNAILSFEKIPLISRSRFLQVLVRSEKVYPGNKKFKRLDLRLRAIRRAFRSESGRVNAFFSQKSGAVDINTMTLLTLFLNEKNDY